MFSIIFTSGGLIYLFGPFKDQAAAVWFDDNFAYRKAVPLTSVTGASNVYSTVVIDTATLVTAGKMLSSCADLRFTDFAGAALPYYIVSGCNTGTTTIHVNHITLGAFNQTIYYYYGNPAAVSQAASADFSSAATDTIGSAGTEEQTKQPTAWWRFDDATGTTAKDSTTNADNGTLGGATLPTWQTEDMCISGKCLAFDGSTSLVLVTTYPKPTDKITVTAWVYATSRTTWATIIKNWSDVTAGQFHFGLENTSGDLSVYITQSDGTQIGPVREGSGIPFPLNSWQYVAFVADGSNVLLYRNGNQVASTAYNGTLKTTYNCVGIGVKPIDACNAASGSTPGFWAGRIDEPKIFDYALTAAQLNANYDSKTRDVAKGASVQFGSDPTTNLANGLAGYWKMDEASWNSNCSTATVTDSSGNGNSGIACPNGSAATVATGKFGNAGSFDGSNDYVQVADSTTVRSATLTVAGWFKVTALGNTFPNLVNKETNSTDRNYVIYIAQSTGDIVGSTSFGGTSTDLDSNVAVNDSAWHHFAYTVSADYTQRMYVDGALKATSTHTTAPDTTNSAALYFANDHGTQNFNGKLDDMRFYNRELSGAEVAQLCNWAPGPSAYFSMEEGSGTTIVDKSSNGNTSGAFAGSGTSFTTGKFGGALSFNGSGYVPMASDISPLKVTSDLSIDAWINSTNFSVTHDIFCKWTGTNSTSSFCLQTNTSGNLIMLVNSGSATTTTTGTIAMTANTWYHVAGVYTTSTSVKVYVNGALDTSNTTSIPASLGTNTTIADVGSENAGTNNMVGKIDEVRFYNYALTAKQVTQDMNAGHPAGGSPVGSMLGWWKFDEGYGTTANNSGSQGSTLNGTLNAIASPATATSGWTQSGKFGKAIAFDGSNDYVGMGSDVAPLKITGEITLSAWINLTSTAAQRDIIAKWTVFANTSSYILYTDASGHLVMKISDGSTVTTTTGSKTLATGTWYHLVGVYSPSASVTLYVNGVQDTQNTTSIPAALNNSTTIFDIGAENTVLNPMNGFIDDVKVYNAALPLQNILIDYNQNASQILGNAGSNASYQTQAANQEYCIPGDATSCVAPIGRWDFEEKTGTTANDTSGNGFAGTLTAGPTWTTGKVGSAIQFDGVDDVVSCTDSACGGPTTGLDMGTRDWTAQAWIKVQASQTSGFIMTKSDFIGGSNPDAWAVIVSTTGKLQSYIRKNGTGEVVATDDAATVNDGTWHFVAVTFTRNGNMVRYVDGKASGTANSISALNGTSIDNAVAFDIGARDIGCCAQNFQGTIDQAKVFGYARSASQVVWDYNRGAPVGQWKLDDCQGTTANDSSGNSNTGTITIGATGTYTTPGTCTTSSASSAWYNGVSGKRNYSLAFDGTDDKIDLGTGSALNPTAAITLSAWVKTPATWASADYPILSRSYTDGSAASPYVTYMIRINSGASIDWSTTSSGATYDQQRYTFAFSTDTWYHITTTSDGANKVIYINGIPVATQAWANSIVARTAKSYIGFWENGSYYKGQIDDARLYNYALTATQVKTLYNNGAVTFSPTTGAP